MSPSSAGTATDPGLPQRALVRTPKAIASPRRLAALRLLAAEPPLSVVEVAGRLRIRLKNASHHLLPADHFCLLLRTLCA